MKFRTRSNVGIMRVNDGGVASAPSRYLCVTAGDHITLQPDEDHCHEDLRVEVLEAQGELLRVRALHDLYADVTRQIVKRGTEFMVSRAHVHAVRTVAGLAIAPVLLRVMSG